MAARRLKRGFSLILILVMAWSLLGCGSGPEEAPPAPEDTDAAAAETPAADEPDTQDAPASPGASDLWAPAIEPSLEASMPRESDVPYPAYPGAVVYSHGYAGEGQASSVIWSITTDPPEDVFAFYREHLEGWHHEDMPREGLDYLLWDGDEEDAGQAYTHLIPAILIREPFEVELDYMDEWLPGIQTEFTVIYPAN